MITKKDIIQIGRALAASRMVTKPSDPGFQTPAEMAAQDQWNRTLNEVAGTLASINPKFMRSRFIAFARGECGPNGGSI